MLKLAALAPESLDFRDISNMLITLQAQEAFLIFRRELDQES
jgi:hypothetical protein